MVRSARDVEAHGVEFIAWRPRQFAARIAAVAVFDAALAAILGIPLADRVVDAGNAAILALLAVLVVATGVPTAVLVRTGTSRVRVDALDSGLAIVSLDGGPLRPEFGARLVWRRLDAVWHRDDTADQLVLDGTEGAIALTRVPGGPPLEVLAAALRAHGVRLD